MFLSRFDFHHIAVSLKFEADTLSHPQDHPTYEQIFQLYWDMAFLTAYHVPPTLISAIIS